MNQSIVNAQDDSSYSIATQAYVSHEPDQTQERVTQQQMIPTSVKTRLLGDLFSNVPSGGADRVLEAEFTGLPNSTSVGFLFTISDKQGRQVFVLPEFTIIINGQIYPSAVYGFGSAPFAWYYDLARGDGSNLVIRANVRNNSGATLNTIICQARFRVIANPGSANGVA